MYGFSLIEFMLVMTLFLLTMVATFPVAVSLYQLYVVRHAASEMQIVLQNAHTNAVTQKYDTSHGIKILPPTYVVFEGESYASRTVSRDKEGIMPEVGSISGPDEFVFAAGTGNVSATGTLVFANAYATTSITVQQHGRIERE